MSKPRPKGLIHELKWARLATAPPAFAANRPRRKGRRALGIRYERRVHEHFDALLGPAYLPSPWFQFASADEARMQWCQPDALYFDLEAGRITIVEVKYQHTVDAWWQLHRYLPVVREVFGPDFQYALCEVVKWYDCAVVFPEPVRLLPELSLARPDGFHVHIYKP